MSCFFEFPPWHRALLLFFYLAWPSHAFPACDEHFRTAANLSLDLFQQGQQRLAAEKAAQEAATDEAKAAAESQIRTVQQERDATIAAIEKVGGVISRVCAQ